MLASMSRGGPARLRSYIYANHVSPTPPWYGSTCRLHNASSPPVYARSPHISEAISSLTNCHPIQPRSHYSCNNAATKGWSQQASFLMQLPCLRPAPERGRVGRHTGMPDRLGVGVRSTPRLVLQTSPRHASPRRLARFGGHAPRPKPLGPASPNHHGDSPAMFG